MKKMHIKTIIAIISLTLAANAGSSIFGVGPGSFGELNYHYSAAALGRGGTEIAFIDSLTLNHTNFALWSKIPQTTLTIDALRYQGLTTSFDGGSSSSTSGNFGGGFLAFPLLKKKLAVGFGLSPLNINESEVEIGPTGSAASAREIIKSSGNISEANLVVSYAFNEQFSVAGAVIYRFGNLMDELTVEYPVDGYADAVIMNDYKIYGTGIGLHGFYSINPSLNLGLSMQLPANLTLVTKQTSLNTQIINDEFRDITFPLMLNAGANYALAERWQSSVDIRYQAWENGYKIDNNAQAGFTDSYRIGLGVERMPQIRRFIAYSEKMNYRAGIALTKWNRLSLGNSVYDFNISAGVGLPIMNMRNRMDIALEMGWRGNRSDNIASENYYRLNISFSASELWFVQEDR